MAFLAERREGQRLRRSEQVTLQGTRGKGVGGGSFFKGEVENSLQTLQKRKKIGKALRSLRDDLDQGG